MTRREWIGRATAVLAIDCGRTHPATRGAMIEAAVGAANDRKFDEAKRYAAAEGLVLFGKKTPSPREMVTPAFWNEFTQNRRIRSVTIEHEKAIENIAEVVAKIAHEYGRKMKAEFVLSKEKAGLTVQQRQPGQTGLLQLEFAVRGDLQARITSKRDLAFVDDAGSMVVTYRALQAWDASGRQLRAWFDLRPNIVAIHVADTGARYPVTIDPIAQQAYLKASNTEAGDLFGHSVAVSGDTLVVGAYRERGGATGVNGNQADNSAAASGAAYVFVRNGATWSKQAYLKASNAGPGDYFGLAVAISGDTIVVVAPEEDGNASGVNGVQNRLGFNHGAVYVFVRQGTTWTQQGYLKSSNSGGGDQFGWSVGLDGDIVVVGAQFEDGGATTINGSESDNSGQDRGAAYVFARNGSSGSQQAYLKATHPGAYRYGFATAISGNTVVGGNDPSGANGVNGSQTDQSAPFSGSAYVYVRTGSVWTQQAYLKASNTDRNDTFGSAVAISGNTMVVGAAYEDSSGTGVNGTQSNNNAPDSGAAYVFIRNGTSWSQQAYLKASNTGAGDWFGFAVAISGDLAAVGAWLEDSLATGVDGDQSSNQATDSGAAYVFVRSGTTWTQHAYLKASNTGTSDLYGKSVAVAGQWVLVGAHWEASGATGVNGNQNSESSALAGAAYLYQLTGLDGGGLRFVPITPCRLLEARSVYAGTKWTGPYGPPALAAGQIRTVLVAGSSRCGIPASAKAFVVNATVDTLYANSGPVDFLTIWPADESRPNFWTLRTSTGGYVANSAIVRSGGGSIHIYSSNTTNLSLDISWYFTDDGTGLLFCPLDSGRPIDTRSIRAYTAGLAAPFGNQRMEAGETRSFRLPSSSRCAIPAAQAYSMQFTSTPGPEADGNPVAYLRAWNTGGGEPPVSNLNSLYGYVMANSSIVPARGDGSIDVKTYNATNFLGDVNGYFAPDDGSGRGLLFFPVRQCRVMSTQDATLSGDFGPPQLSPSSDREIRFPASTRCAGLPASARAWAVNATLLPNGSPVAFLSLWEAGTNWPAVSQLHAFQGQTVSNSAIVLGSASGGIAIKVSNTADAALEVAGYFGRP